MDANALVERAVSAVDKSTIYADGKSTYRRIPEFDEAWPKGAKCDCSGFIAWCLQIAPDGKLRDVEPYSTLHPERGYFETTAIYADGREDKRGLFRQLRDPLPGALLVYPDYKDKQGKHRQGHIGIICQVDGPGIAGVRSVVHCSLGNYNRFQDAVKLTTPGPWLAHPESIIIWFEELDA